MGTASTTLDSASRHPEPTGPDLVITTSTLGNAGQPATNVSRQETGSPT